jgi:hypothetical protein
MVTRNQHLDQRMNWFDRQFLRAQDFADESDYHVDRRRRHLRMLHTPGVAEGLLTRGTQGDGVVTVDPGTAVDGLGREIVLLTASQPINLPDNVTRAQLYVSYEEAEAERSKDPGIIGYTRIVETPRFDLRELEPNPGKVPTGGVLLAELALNGGKLTEEPDNDARVAAGALIGDVAVFSITLKRVGQPATEWPRLTASGPGQVTLDGDLRLTGDRELAFGANGTFRATNDLHFLLGPAPGLAVERFRISDTGVAQLLGESSEPLLTVTSGIVQVGDEQTLLPFQVNGDTEINGELTLRRSSAHTGEPAISAPNRLHISGGELLYLLNKSGVIVGKEGGGTGTLSVQGMLTLGDGLRFGGGPSVKAITSDPNLSGASDTTVPTERAVRSYVDRRLGIQAGSGSASGGLQPATPDKVQTVQFQTPFAAPPVVLVSVSALDADQRFNLRYEVRPDHVSTTQFDIVYHSWADTFIFLLNVNWIAIGRMP